MFELPYSLFKYLILFNRHHRRPKSVLLERSILIGATLIAIVQLMNESLAIYVSARPARLYAALHLPCRE